MFGDHHWEGIIWLMILEWFIPQDIELWASSYVWSWKFTYSTSETLSCVRWLKPFFVSMNLNSPPIFFSFFSDGSGRCYHPDLLIKKKITWEYEGTLVDHGQPSGGIVLKFCRFTDCGVCRLTGVCCLPIYRFSTTRIIGKIRDKGRDFSFCFLLEPTPAIVSPLICLNMFLGAEPCSDLFCRNHVSNLN